MFFEFLRKYFLIFVAVGLSIAGAMICIFAPPAPIIALCGLLAAQFLGLGMAAAIAAPLALAIVATSVALTILAIGLIGFGIIKLIGLMFDAFRKDQPNSEMMENEISEENTENDDNTHDDDNTHTDSEEDVNSVVETYEQEEHGITVEHGHEQDQDIIIASTTSPTFSISAHTDLPPQNPIQLPNNDSPNVRVTIVPPKDIEIMGHSEDVNSEKKEEVISQDTTKGEVYPERYVIEVTGNTDVEKELVLPRNEEQTEQPKVAQTLGQVGVFPNVVSTTEDSNASSTKKPKKENGCSLM